MIFHSKKTNKFPEIASHSLKYAKKLQSDMGE